MLTYEDLGINEGSVYKNKETETCLNANEMLTICNRLSELGFDISEFASEIKGGYIEIKLGKYGLTQKIENLKKLCSEMLKEIEDIKSAS